MSAADNAHLPLVTADLPGTGGRRLGPDDFVVEEIPAYTPSGSGTHCFAWIEKRGLTTRAAIERIASALSVRSNDIGVAGLKDRHAVTRQWISLPDVDPARVTSLAWDDLRVLEAARHGNKLRTGHLRGNRFTVVLHEVAADAGPTARRVLERLGASGLPNFFGPQRFGFHGDNATQALAMLRGERPLPRDRQKKRLLLSSIQSLLFNDVLADRVRRDELSLLLGGEVLQKRESGGIFVSEDRQTDQQRLLSGELAITGPICGPRAPMPKEGSPARAREEAVFAAHTLGPDDFVRFGRLARGGRRQLTVLISEARVDELDGGLRLSFALPSGSYATVLLREVTKDDGATAPA